MNPGDIRLGAPYAAGSGVLFTTNMGGVLASLEVAPNQVTVYPKSGNGRSVTYPVTSISPNRISIGSATEGLDHAWSAGDQVMLQATSTGISLTTTGSSGAATLVNGILNVPQYSGGGSTKIGGWVVGAGSSLQSGSGLFPPVIAAVGGTLSACQVVATVNPVAGGFAFQIKKNGTNIFSSPQTVPASTTTVVTFSSFSVPTFAEGDVFALVTSSVGTGIEGVVFQLVD